MTHVINLYHHYELLWAWTSRTIRARYQQSALGILWTITQPVAQVLIFTVIFTIILPVDTGDVPYPVFNFVAMSPWLFFSSAVADMVASLVANMNLVTKIYFPREILPLSAMLARLLDFGIGLVLIFVLIVAYGMPVHIQGWLLIPFVTVIPMALALGMGLIGAALNVFYRDVQHVYELAFRIWFYLSPIIYPVDRVAELPELVQKVYFLNPLVGIFEAYRELLLHGRMPGATLLPAAIISFLVLIVGYWFFKRLEFQFADVV